MNKLPEMLTKGAFGEVLVQLRLLQHAVQAAPPIKDSGNDLIAIRESNIKAIQVKTTGSFPVEFNAKDLPPRFHLLAIVVLSDFADLGQCKFKVSLDNSEIFLLEKEHAVKGYFSKDELQQYRLNEERVNKLFPPEMVARPIRAEAK